MTKTLIQTIILLLLANLFYGQSKNEKEVPGHQAVA